jgi:hypothetical protein
MSDKISLEGPLGLIDGKLTLQIPLAAGGDKLAPFILDDGAPVELLEFHTAKAVRSKARRKG